MASFRLVSLLICATFVTYACCTGFRILSCFALLNLIMEFTKPAVCLLIWLMSEVLGNPEMDL